jgi:RND family efflux transporter MFP subunit
MKTSKKFLPLSLAILMIISGCSGEKTIENEENSEGITRTQEAVKEVSIFDLNSDEALLFIEKTGTTQSSQTAEVTPQVSGEVIEIKVEIGNSVKEGEVLVELGNSLSTDLQELNLYSSEIGLNLSITSQENTESITENSISAAEIAISTAYNNYLSALNKKQLNIENYNRSFVDSQISFNSAKTSYLAAEDSYLNGLEILDQLREDESISESQIQTQETTTDSLKLNMELAENQFIQAENSILTLKSTNQSTIDSLDLAIITAEEQYHSALNNIQATELQGNSQKIAAENQLLQSETQYQTSQINDYYKYVTAPIDGMITSITIEEGNLVAPGQTIITIENPESTVAITSVSFHEAIKISESESILILSDHFISEGEISYISPVANSSTKKIEVEIELDENTIPSEQFVDIAFKIGDENNIYIPLNSVSQGTNSYTVKVVGEKNKVEKKEIIIGEVIGNYVEIIDGLSGEELIIEAGVNFISEGETVKIVYNY